ncbi:MexX/AxyX family multidrug efflux RND transporter periplasmic adaptor subunit [Burkholderia alba]|uniref:MexX/AxyX family multidrug efflux RND transporter periplasmic adaptor subunit n=1 Tax=Burkholderia alba TaxID=2683677 RepID=UPI002B054B0F|nr:MexX/AxyX family multidrug efflux RND transporter periplasmic adaptor subunit [Burkholderia alba]
MKNKRAVVRPPLLLILAAVLFAAGCGKRDGGEAAAQPRPATVVTVHTAPVPLSVELPGRLEAYRQAEVRARVAGIVTARPYQEGQEVKAGAVLFRIDPAPLQAARDAAEGALAKAQAALLAAADKRRRYDDLVRDRAVSERDQTEAVADERQARAAVTSAQADLARAKLQLGYATVTAPIDGRARRALVTEGALVGQDQATPLTTVEQLDPIYVNFSQPAADVDALRHAVRSGRAAGIAQQDIEVTLLRADGTPYSHKGKLLFADLAVDPATDTVAMRALFPNPDRDLLPGAYVRIALDRAIERNAILVPRDAVLRSADHAAVKVVGQDGKIRDVTVETAQMKGAEWLITRGLQGGERVVVDNAAQFEAGAAVKAVERGAAAPAGASAAHAAAPGNT